MLVLWFGGTSEGVSTAFRQLLGDERLNGVRLPVTPEDTVVGEPFHGGLDAALDRFVHGEVTFVSAFGDRTRHLAGCVYCPGFAGSVREYWSGYVECVDGLELSAYDQLLGTDGIAFYGRFVDDLPDVEVPSISMETFPWEHWLLIVGGVRDADGRWAVRRGPAADGHTPRGPTA